MRTDSGEKENLTHPLEAEYGLTADELLDAIQSRFRLKVALEGAVAEVHLKRKIEALRAGGAVNDFEEHDLNGHPDFTASPRGAMPELKIECKNVRNDEYRTRATLVAYKVEVQKTRAARADPSSRYYDVGYFDILAVCLGKKTGNWSDFLFVKADDLARHSQHPEKLAVMQRVPLPNADDLTPWYRTLQEVLSAIAGEPEG